MLTGGVAGRLVVVGGGVIGLACAWRLARRGLAVTVIERGRTGREASWAAAGMLAPHAETEFHEVELLGLGEASQALWPSFAASLEAESGQTIGLDRTGTLVVAVDRDDGEALDRLVRHQQGLGLGVERLSMSSLREREPLLSPTLAGGVWCPTDWQVGTRRLLSALREACRRRGVEVVEGVEVTRVVRDEGGVRGVEAADGSRYEADAVLIAAGAWSRSIGGLEPVRLATRPVKGQMLSVRVPSGVEGIRHVIRAPRAYLVPKPDGTIVIGASMEDQGFDRSMRVDSVVRLLDGAIEVVPAIREMELLDLWTGLRPGTRDNGPLLGEGGVPGLFVATGHHRNGIQQTPVTALAMESLIVEGRLDAAIAPFPATRFRQGPAP